MSESERRQTTKGIWMSKNKRQDLTEGGTKRMADNILVMDVEGTDGRERGEDQDFERKSALFALATSEVLIINIWEHQVGLYQGANMGLLKVVFEVNLELFLKNTKYVSGWRFIWRWLNLTGQILGRSSFSSFEITWVPLLSRIYATRWFKIWREYGLDYLNRQAWRNQR